MPSSRRARQPASAKAKSDRARALKDSEALVLCRGTNLFVPVTKLQPCYDCAKRDVKLTFSRISDRYEGQRICRVCVQSFKRKSGSALVD